VTERQRFIDHYWETRDLRTVDHRTRLRIAVVDRLLTHRRGRLLDVGCGRGCVAAYFAENGFDVTAIDLSPMAVEWTRRQHHRIRAEVLDLESEPVTGSYDVILCLEVLQQVRDPDRVLSKLAYALSEEGELIVSLPNEFHLARRLNILRGYIDFGGFDESHIRLYTVAEHRRLLLKCGLDTVAVRCQSIVPPRWWAGRLHVWGNRLAAKWPELFALSVIYKCRARSLDVANHQ
jgi:SAM-dependent methyltransferase